MLRIGPTVQPLFHCSGADQLLYVRLSLVRVTGSALNRLFPVYSQFSEHSIHRAVPISYDQEMHYLMPESCPVL